MILFACSACGKRLQAQDKLAGRNVKCPSCAHLVAIPAAQAPQPTPPTPTQSWPPPAADTSGGEQTITQPPPPQAPEVHPTATGTPAAAQGTGPGADLPGIESGHAPSTTPSVGASPPAGSGGQAYDFLAPPQQPDEIGRLGPYRILKVLGMGGMGVVFQAEDPQLHRLVAVKVMLPTLAATPQARQRFLREAQAAAAVEHDHIIHINQVGEDRGVPFVAMPLLKGESLDDRLHREGHLPIAEVLRIGREIAEGLAAAHEHGLVHRDIKPANIWLEATHSPLAPRRRGVGGVGGRVKILDFGLARTAADDSHLTQSGAIMGTPAYMAPEQARGEKVEARADLFSLGCVLYRMAAGELPFKGKDTMSMLLALVNDQPRPLRDCNPDVPRALSDLVMHLLAKVPADRPPSARAVAEALETLQGEQSDIPEVLEVVLPAATEQPSARPLQADSRRLRSGADKPSTPAVAPSPIPRTTAPRKSRTLLTCGCLGLSVVLLTVGGIVLGGYWLASWGVPRLIDDFKGEMEKQKGWEEVARFWKPPPADAGPEQLFPLQFEDCRRVSHDQEADIPQLNIQAEGHHAVYQCVQDQMEVFVYRVTPLEKETLFRRAMEQIQPANDNPDRPGLGQRHGKEDGTLYRSVSGSAESTRIIYHLSPPSRNGILFWDKGWLFVVCTRSKGDAAEFLKRYLAVLSSQSPP